MSFSFGAGLSFGAPASAGPGAAKKEKKRLFSAEARKGKLDALAAAIQSIAEDVRKLSSSTDVGVPSSTRYDASVSLAPDYRRALYGIDSSRLDLGDKVAASQRRGSKDGGRKGTTRELLLGEQPLHYGLWGQLPSVVAQDAPAGTLTGAMRSEAAAVDELVTASLTAAMAKRAQHIALLADERKAQRAQERAASKAPVDGPARGLILPRVASLGVRALLEFLAATAQEQPELCARPLSLLSATLAGFEPQSLLPPGAAGAAEGAADATGQSAEDAALAADQEAMLDSIKALLTQFAQHAGPAAQLAGPRATALSGLVSLALARGRLDDIAPVARALLQQPEGRDGPSSDCSSAGVPVPAPMQALARLARGVLPSLAIVPGPSTLAGTVDVRGVSEAPSALACDGKHVYAVLQSAQRLIRVGTGYGDTAPGAVDGGMELAPLLARVRGGVARTSVLCVPGGLLLVAHAASGPAVSWFLPLSPDAPLPAASAAVGVRTTDHGGLGALPTGTAALAVDLLAEAGAPLLGPVGTNAAFLALGGTAGAVTVLMRAPDAPRAGIIRTVSTQAGLPPATPAATARASPAVSTPTPEKAAAGGDAGKPAADAGSAALSADERDALEAPVAGTTACVVKHYKLEARGAGQPPVLTLQSWERFDLPPTASDCDLLEVTAASAAPADLPAHVNVRCLASTGTCDVAVADNGEVYYRGDGVPLASPAAAAWSAYAPVAKLKLRVSQVSLAEGARHALLVTDEGGLYAVGANEDGECGVGAEGKAGNAVAAPTRVAGADGALLKLKIVSAAVAAGRSMAVASDGTVWAWGLDSSHGELGLGRKKSAVKGGVRKKDPTSVPLSQYVFSSMVEAAVPGSADAGEAGASAAVPVLAASASVAGGPGAASSTSAPVFSFSPAQLSAAPAPAPAAAFSFAPAAPAPASAAAPTAAFSFAPAAPAAAPTAAFSFAPAGSAVTAGDASATPLFAFVPATVPPAVRASGAKFGYAPPPAPPLPAGLNEEARMIAWGLSDYHNSPDEARAAHYAAREDVKSAGASGTAASASGRSFGEDVDAFDPKSSAVALGRAHALLMTRGGAVWSMGSTAQGQCGRVPAPSTDKEVNPGPVAGLPCRALAIAAAGDVSAVLCADGSVWAFGGNASGQCGRAAESSPHVLSPIRVNVPGPSPAAAISACADALFVVTADGALHVVGKRAGVAVAEGAPEACHLPALVKVGKPVANVLARADGGALAVPSLSPLTAAVLGRASGYVTPAGEDATAGFGLVLLTEGAGGAGHYAMRMCGVGVKGKGTGARHISDATADLSVYGATFSSQPAPVCVDPINAVLWAVGMAGPGDALHVKLTRFEPAAEARAAQPQAGCGRALLSDPRFSVPLSAGATMSAPRLGAALLAIVDAMRDHAEGGAQTVGGHDDGARALVDATGTLHERALKAADEYENNRHAGKGRLTSSWGMSSPDHVAFKVDKDVWLTGVGTYSTTGPYKGTHFICIGNDSRGTKIASVDVDAPADSKGEVFPFWFEEPVLIEAGVQMHWTGQHRSPSGSGWYMDMSGGSTVRHETAGVTFEFSQTGDSNNNGTSPSRGLLPALLFKLPSDVDREALRLKRGGGGSAGIAGLMTGRLPTVRPGIMSSFASPASASELVALTEWSLARLIDGIADSSNSALARSVLMASLKLLHSNLGAVQDGGDAVSAADRVTALLTPTPAEVADAVKRLPAEGLTVGDELSFTMDSPKGSRPRWAAADPAELAAQLWGLHRCITSTLSAVLDLGDAALCAEAQAAYVACFNALHPSWRLKALRLAALVRAMGSPVTAGAAGRSSAAADDAPADSLADARSTTARLLECTLMALVQAAGDRSDIVALAKEQAAGASRVRSLLATALFPAEAPERAGSAWASAAAGPPPAVEAPLLELYSQELAEETGQAGIDAAFMAEAGAVPLLRLLRKAAAASIAAAASDSAGLAPPFVGASVGPAPPFPRWAGCAAQVLAGVIDEVAGELASAHATPDADAAKPRAPPPLCSIMRFSSISGVGWGYSGSPDKVSFTVDAPIWVAGFGLFAGSGAMAGTAKLLEGRGSDSAAVLASAEVAWESTTQDPQPVLLDAPVLLEADTTYTAYINVSTRGLSSHSGNSGQLSATGDDGVKFVFSHSEGSTNGTSESSGQVPQILYYTSDPATPARGVEKAANVAFGATTLRDLARCTKARVAIAKARQAGAADAAGAPGSAALNSAAAAPPPELLGAEDKGSALGAAGFGAGFGFGLFSDAAQVSEVKPVAAPRAHPVGALTRGASLAGGADGKGARADALGAAAAGSTGQPPSSGTAATRVSAAEAAFEASHARTQRFSALLLATVDHAEAVLDSAELGAPRPGAALPAAVYAALDADPVLAQLLPRALGHASAAMNREPSLAYCFADRLHGLLLRVDALVASAKAAALDSAMHAEGASTADSVGGRAAVDVGAGGGSGSGAHPARLQRLVSDGSIERMAGADADGDLGADDESDASPGAVAARALAALDDHESFVARRMVETSHPYASPCRLQWDLAFPPGTAFMVVAMDAQCATVQPEDALSLYADAACVQRVGQPLFGQPVGAADDAGADRAPGGARRKAVAQRWPPSVMLVPGDRLSLVFQAATDYAPNPRRSRWGVRVTVTAHGSAPPPTIGALLPPTRLPLLPLLRESAHAVAVTAACGIEAALSSRELLSIAKAAAVRAPEVLRAALLDRALALVGIRSAGQQVAAPGAAPASSSFASSLLPVPEALWEWQPIANAAARVGSDGDSVTPGDRTNTGAVLTQRGITRGQIAWTIKVDEETSSQCTCLGIALDDVSQGEYTGNAKAWTVRCYNGYRYGAGAEDRSSPADKINKGDTAAFCLDMDAGELRLSVRGQREITLFKGLDKKAGARAFKPCVLFYQSGGGRKVSLRSFEASASALAELTGEASKVNAAAAEGDADIMAPTDWPLWAQTAAAMRVFAGGIAAAPPSPAARDFLHALAFEAPECAAGDASALSGNGLDAGAALGAAGSAASAAAFASWLERLDAAERDEAKRLRAVVVAELPLEAPSPTPAGPFTPSAASPAAELERTTRKLSAASCTALRAVFAAYLFHGGLVDDGMAAAAFVQAHPQAGLAAVRGLASSAGDAVLRARLDRAVSSSATATCEALARATDAALPPALRVLVRVWRSVVTAMRQPLLAGEAAAAKEASAAAAKAATAGATAPPAGAAGAVGGGVPVVVPARIEAQRKHAAIAEVRARLATASYRVDGGAAGAELPRADALFEEGMLDRLEALALARAELDLPLHLTPGMAWDAAKARGCPLRGMPGAGSVVSGFFAGPTVAAGDEPALIFGVPLERDAAAVHYFEVEVVDQPKGKAMAVGWAPERDPASVVRTMLGKGGDGSMGFCAEEGGVLYGSGMPAVGPFNEGDVVGAGYVPCLNYVFFTLNGREISHKYCPPSFARPPRAVAADDSGMWGLRPAVTALSGASFNLNAGGAPFACDEMETLRKAAVEAAKAKALPLAPGAGAAEAGAGAAGVVATPAPLLLLDGASTRSADVVARVRLLMDVTPAVDALVEMRSGVDAGLPGPRALVRSTSSGGSMRPVSLTRGSSLSSDCAGAVAWDGAAGHALLTSASPQLRAVAAELEALESPTATAKGPVPVLSELLSFAVLGPQGPGEPNDESPAKALEELRLLLTVRAHRGGRRLAALRSAANLLSSLRSPLALCEIAFSLGATLAPGAGDAEGAAQAGDGAGAEAEAAPGGLLAAAGTTWTVSPIVDDILGGGAAAVAGVRAAFHALLESAASHIARPGAPASTTWLASSRRQLQLLCLRLWRAPLDGDDFAFLQRSVVFAQLQEAMAAAAAADAPAATPTAPGAAVHVVRWVDVTPGADAVEVSSGRDRKGMLVAASTETYWESDGAANTDAKTVTVTLSEADVRAAVERAAPGAAAVMPDLVVAGAAVHVDHSRDTEKRIRRLELTVTAPARAEPLDAVTVDREAAGWLLLAPKRQAGAGQPEAVALTAGGKWAASGPLRLTIAVKPSASSQIRLRGLRIYAVAPAAAAPASLGDGLSVEACALTTFRGLTARVFADLSRSFAGGDAEGAASALGTSQDGSAPAPSAGSEGEHAAVGLPPGVALAAGRGVGSDLRHRIAGLVFEGDAATHAPPAGLSRGVSRSGLGAGTGMLQTRLLGLMRGELDAHRAALVAARKAAGAAPAPADAFPLELADVLRALSASSAGAKHVAKADMMATLLRLLPVASQRVQASLLATLRRVLPVVSPAHLDAHLSVPRALLSRALAARAEAAGCAAASPVSAVGGAGALPGLSSPDDLELATGKGATAAYILLLVARSLEVQVKGRTAGRPVTTTSAVNDDAMPGRLRAEEAGVLAGLLRELMASQPAWREALIGPVQHALAALPATIEGVMAAPARSAHLPVVWLACGGLLLIGEGVEGVNVEAAASAAARSAAAKAAAEAAAAAKPVHCDQHDDGHTLADFACADCGSAEAPWHACGSCDATLHMPRGKRNHARKPIARPRPVEQAGPALEHLPGTACTRFKLPWLQVAVYTARCLASLEIKADQHPMARHAAVSTAQRCRFCETDLTSDSTSAVLPASAALEAVCNSPECEAKAAGACVRVKDCGHACGGVRGETATHCPPCFHGCDGACADPEALCSICYTEGLAQAPILHLTCGHAFHADCLRAKVRAGWPGPRIDFSFLGCPLCRARIAHPALAPLLEPVVALEETVRRKALMRLRFENAERVPELTDPASRWYGNPAGYAMDRFAYYQCFKCAQPYYGGEARCAAAGGAFKAEDLVCGSCLPHGTDADCPKHGKEFIQWKCRYCCAPSIFFCFGTTHFCNPCHDRYSECQERAASGRLPHCPAGPVGKQLPGTEADCPLRVHHPPTGEEFCLGCSICREAATF